MAIESAATIRNLLPAAFPQREQIERVVRDTVKRLSDAPRSITLRCADAPMAPDWVSLEAHYEHRVAWTGFHALATREEIVSRLLLLDTRETGGG